MTERVYLHVGPHKTGTTYVQGLLQVNRGRIAEQGVLSPRLTLTAIRDLMDRDRTPAFGGGWQRVRRALQKWRGPSAVVSHEVISTAAETEVRRLVGGLTPYDVHIVYTARDLSRVLPAMWQTGLRGTRSYTWEEYARSVRRPGRSPLPWGRRFWHNHDAPAVLQRWRGHLPAENLHVVTVPRPGSPPELLWQRFCTVLGIDTSGHDLHPPRSNPSLGTAESELLRRVNALLEGADVSAGDRLSRMRWIGRELETRQQMATFTLPPEDLGWVSRRAQRVISGLSGGGYEIVGDLDELVPQPVAPQLSRHPSDADPEAVLDVAVDTIGRLVIEMARSGSSRRMGAVASGRNRQA